MDTHGKQERRSLPIDHVPGPAPPRSTRNWQDEMRRDEHAGRHFLTLSPAPAGERDQAWRDCGMFFFFFLFCRTRSRRAPIPSPLRYLHSIASTVHYEEESNPSAAALPPAPCTLQQARCLKAWNLGQCPSHLPMSPQQAARRSSFQQGGSEVRGEVGGGEREQETLHKTLCARVRRQASAV